MCVFCCRSFFVSSATPSDVFRGEIQHQGKVVSRVEGSWIRNVCFDGEELFDISSAEPAATLGVDDSVRLPSDCTVREDLIALSSGDYGIAQEAKVKLEVLQRADRAQRKEGAEARGVDV